MFAGTVNKAGDTPLSLACANGHLDIIKYFVNEHHCDPRSEHFIWHINCCITQYTCTYTDTVNKAGDTPLSLACTNGYLDTVKYLVNEHHCNPRSEHCIYGTSIACCIIQCICTCTGTVNKAGDTPLSLAYKGGHWEVVKHLAIIHYCDTKSKSHILNSLLVL